MSPFQSLVSCSAQLVSGWWTSPRGSSSLYTLIDKMLMHRQNELDRLEILKVHPSCVAHGDLLVWVVCRGCMKQLGFYSSSSTKEILTCDALMVTVYFMEDLNRILSFNDFLGSRTGN